MPKIKKPDGTTVKIRRKPKVKNPMKKRRQGVT